MIYSHFNVRLTLLMHVLRVTPNTPSCEFRSASDQEELFKKKKNRFSRNSNRYCIASTADLALTQFSLRLIGCRAHDVVVDSSIYFQDMRHPFWNCNNIFFSPFYFMCDWKSLTGCMSGYDFVSLHPLWIWCSTCDVKWIYGFENRWLTLWSGEKWPFIRTDLNVYKSLDNKDEKKKIFCELLNL